MYLYFYLKLFKVVLIINLVKSLYMVLSLIGILYVK